MGSRAYHDTEPDGAEPNLNALDWQELICTRRGRKPGAANHKMKALD